MSSTTKSRTAVPPRRATLVLVCLVVWPLAAASADAVGIWGAIGSAAITLGAVVLSFDRPAAAAMLRPRARLVLVGALVGLAMAALTHLLYPVAARTLPWVADDTAQLYAALRAPSLAVATIALIPIIVGEDLVWRGIVQAELVQRLGVPAGITLAAVAYALGHAPLGSPVLVSAALGCGLVWSTLGAATGSLVAPLVSHVTWNFVVLLWLPLHH